MDTSGLEEWMDKHSIGAVVQDEDAFHYKFLSITQSPYIVYYQWLYDVLHKPLLAVVWPRRMTDYAKQVVKRLIEYAKNYDLATISWMADGVDRLVHEESIKQWIPTIAVLGWWLAHYLRSRDHGFMQKIVDNGWLVVSDFPLKQKPTHYTFPQRNRIVAGLSDVVFVPEASEKSGSLITVDYALSMNKPVYGAPHSLFVDTHMWLHRYIAEKHVKLVYDLEKFLDEYFSSAWSASVVHTNLSVEEKAIVMMFETYSSLSLQDIVSHMKKSSADVMHLLTLLELSWVVYQSAPGQYALA